MFIIGNQFRGGGQWSQRFTFPFRSMGDTNREKEGAGGAPLPSRAGPAGSAESWRIEDDEGYFLEWVGGVLKRGRAESAADDGEWSVVVDWKAGTNSSPVNPLEFPISDD